MPKPGRESLSRTIRAAKFRREFLRRSESYKRAFNKFYATYGDWVKAGLHPSWPQLEARRLGEDPEKLGKKSFPARAHEAKQRFEKAWRISPRDPKDDHSPFLWGGHFWVITDGPAHNWGANPEVLTLCIHTGGPIKEVMAQVAMRIKAHQTERATFAPQRVVHRKRWDKFEAYLQAYDKKREGKTDREIADELGLNGEKTALLHRNNAAMWIMRVEGGEW